MRQQRHIRLNLSFYQSMYRRSRTMTYGNWFINGDYWCNNHGLIFKAESHQTNLGQIRCNLCNCQVRLKPRVSRVNAERRRRQKHKTFISTWKRELNFV
jgi:hypothetical protein